MKQRIVRFPAALLAAAGLVWFCIPIHWNVLNIGNVFGIAVCAVILLVCLFYPFIRKRCAVSKGWRVVWRIALVCFCAGILWAGVLTGLMISGTKSVPPESATVVVLGSKVSGRVPSADLMERIRTAGTYLSAHPDAKCIVSGGRGAGELVTEAAVMKEYLIKMGIDSSRILTEDRSVSTQENLENSLALIDRQGMNRDLAIVTDEYHEYRAGRIAENLGAKPYPICAHTPWYIFSACYGRELLALTEFLLFP